MPSDSYLDVQEEEEATEIILKYFLLLLLFDDVFFFFFFLNYITFFKLNIVLYLFPQLFVISLRLMWFALAWGWTVLDKKKHLNGTFLLSTKHISIDRKY